MKTSRSKKLFDRALKNIPGGVNSPVRAFKSVGSSPLFIKKAKGPYVWDEDGNRYIDYVGSWGPMLFGHSHPAINKTLRSIIGFGTSFGAPTELEVQMAEMIRKLIPSMELVRMVNSGTEATMSAIRLARAYTGREKIIKFEGCYHGHADSFLIKAGSGALTLGVPDSPGIPRGTAEGTLTATFNNLESVTSLVDQWPDQIAAIIIEPIVGNMGCIPPKTGFLPGVRKICDAHKIVLIFDEVMTGFRVHSGGAQTLFGVKPDLTTLGKIIGGGLPVGAYGGRKEIMNLVAPSGPMYQAGTLSGNPLAMGAGLEMLKMISRQKTLYKSLEKKGTLLENGIQEILVKLDLQLTFNRIGSMFTLFFTHGPVIDYHSAKTSDTGKFAQFFNLMLGEGIYLAPSQFEAAFLSTAHTEQMIAKTNRAASKTLKRIYSR